MKLLKFLAHKFDKWYCQERYQREYKSQQFIRINERPIEYRFILQALTRAYPVTVLDVGTGITALPRLLRNCGFVVTAIDNIVDYWPKGMFNRHFFVVNDDITDTEIKKKFDFVICVSVLEHIKNYETAVQSMFNLLKPGGYLVLTFPYNENKYIQNLYKLPEAGYGQDSNCICRVFSRQELDGWLEKNNEEIIEQEYWQVFTGDFWTFGERLYPPRQVSKDEKHQLTCLLIKKQ